MSASRTAQTAHMAFKPRGSVVLRRVNAVRDVMSDRRWRTPHELQKELERRNQILSDSSLTARLRDLRKAKYGSHVVNSRPRKGSSQWEYQVLPPTWWTEGDRTQAERPARDETCTPHVQAVESPNTDAALPHPAACVKTTEEIGAKRIRREARGQCALGDAAAPPERWQM